MSSGMLICVVSFTGDEVPLKVGTKKEVDNYIQLEVESHPTLLIPEDFTIKSFWLDVSNTGRQLNFEIEAKDGQTTNPVPCY